MKIYKNFSVDKAKYLMYYIAMEKSNEKIEQKELLLKKKDKFRLACKIFIAGTYISLASALASGIAGAVFVFKSNDALQNFKDSQEYEVAIQEQERIIKDEYYNNLISSNETIEKINYLLSDENAKIILSSSNTPLKMAYFNNKKNANYSWISLGTGIFIAISSVVVNIKASIKQDELNDEILALDKDKIKSRYVDWQEIFEI